MGRLGVSRLQVHSQRPSWLGVLERGSNHVSGVESPGFSSSAVALPVGSLWKLSDGRCPRLLELALGWSISGSGGMESVASEGWPGVDGASPDSLLCAGPSLNAGTSARTGPQVLSPRSETRGLDQLGTAFHLSFRPVLRAQTVKPAREAGTQAPAHSPSGTADLGGRAHSRWECLTRGLL